MGDKGTGAEQGKTCFFKKCQLCSADSHRCASGIMQQKIKPRTESNNLLRKYFSFQKVIFCEFFFYSFREKNNEDD